MIEYRIGKRFPHEEYLNKGDRNQAMLTDSFFNVVNVLSNVTNEEKQTYKEGKLVVSLFIKDEIPFIIFSLDGWGFDANLNIAKLKPELLNDWLNGDANVINLLLVEATTGKLEVIRLIAIPPEMAQKIKDTCKQHREHNMALLDNKIASINALIPADVMVENAVMSYTFEGKL